MDTLRLANRFALLLAGLTLLAGPQALAQRSLAVAPAAPGGQRMALVVGNAAYPGDLRLRNPIHDARAMAAKLLGLGFQVTERENLTERQLGVAIDNFAGQLGRDDVGLFYFSGHGAQLGGQSYLIPVDVNAKSLAYLKVSSVPLQQVLDDLRQAGNGSNFVFLDACRNTPRLARRRGLEGGLAQPRQVPIGTFIGFATAPGETAEDGSGHHGPFTQALLDHLSAPGLTADQVFHKVVNEVYHDTDRRQRPWSQSSLNQDFYFATQAVPKATPATAAQSPTAEQLAWASIASSTDPQDFADFLKLYPNGLHAGVAKLREEHLQRMQQAAAIRMRPSPVMTVPPVAENKPTRVAKPAVSFASPQVKVGAKKPRPPPAQSPPKRPANQTASKLPGEEPAPAPSTEPPAVAQTKPLSGTKEPQLPKPSEPAPAPSIEPPAVAQTKPLSGTKEPQLPKPSEPATLQLGGKPRNAEAPPVTPPTHVGTQTEPEGAATIGSEQEPSASAKKEGASGGSSGSAATVGLGFVSVLSAAYANTEYAKYDHDYNCDPTSSTDCHPENANSELSQSRIGGILAGIALIGAIVSYNISDTPSTASRGFHVEPSVIPEPGRPALALRVTRRW